MKKTAEAINAEFRNLIDAFGANDKPAAKLFGKANWVDLDSLSRQLYYHMWPAHNSMIGAVRDIKSGAARWEDKILTRQESYLVDNF